MANDGSLGVGTQSPFDTSTQAGITSLLNAIRSSDLSSEQKNELRDLTFLYINGGRDQSVGIALAQKIGAAGIQPPQTTTVPEEIVHKPTTTQPEPTATNFGGGRPAPQFSALTTPIEQPEPASTPTPDPVPAEQPTPAQDDLTPTIPSTPPAPKPSTPVLEPATPQSVPATPPSSGAQPTADTMRVATESAASDNTLRRIREIKSLVNNKVGNPVNLVDINNAVGREYMAALLDAMKKLNSGTSTLSAMERLERAYLAVEKAIADYEPEVAAVTPGPVTTSTPKITTKPATAPQSEPTAAPATPINTAPTPTPRPLAQPTTPQTAPPVPPIHPPAKIAVKPPITDPISTPEPTSSTPSVDAPASTSVPATLVKVQGNQPVSASVETPMPPADLPVSASAPKLGHIVPGTPAGEPSPVPEKRKETEVQSGWGPSTETIKSEAKLDESVVPLSEVKEKLHTPNDLPSPADVSSVAGDPLTTKEVDDGLQQLLAEWPLFKKSGLFGTGPNGREHPTFKKIASLQIPLLLAGRFEGATQEIKQSITDYMNGWRYEQGIVYEQGETFEHYLRRVIRHILDLQKGKR